MQQFFTKGPEAVSATAAAAAARGLFDDVISGRGDPSVSEKKKPKPVNGTKPKPAAAAAGSGDDDSGDEDYKPGMVEEAPASGDEDEGEAEEVDEGDDGVVKAKKVKVPSFKKWYKPSNREVDEWTRAQKESKVPYLSEKQRGELTISDNPVYRFDGSTLKPHYIGKGKDAEGEDEYVLFRGAEIWKFNTHKGLLDWCAENSSAKPKEKPDPDALSCGTCKKLIKGRDGRLEEAKRQALYYSLDEPSPDHAFYRDCVRTMLTCTELAKCSDCWGAPPASEFKEGYHGNTDADSEEAGEEQLLTDAVAAEADRARAKKQKGEQKKRKKPKKPKSSDEYTAEVEMQEAAALAGDQYADESDEEDRSDASDISLGSQDETAGPVSKNLQPNMMKQDKASEDLRRLQADAKALYAADVTPFATVEHGIPAHLIPNVVSRVKTYLSEKIVRSDPVKFVEEKKDTHAHRVLRAMVQYYIMHEWLESLNSLGKRGQLSAYVTPQNGVIRAREPAVYRELAQVMGKSEFRSDPIAFLAQWPGKNDPVYKILVQLVKVTVFKCDKDRVLGMTKPIPDDSSKAPIIEREEKRRLEREESMEAAQSQSKRKAEEEKARMQPPQKKHKPEPPVEPAAPDEESPSAPASPEQTESPQSTSSQPPPLPVAPVRTTSVLRTAEGQPAAVNGYTNDSAKWMAEQFEKAKAAGFEEGVVAGRKAEKEYILNEYLSCVICTEPLVGLQLAHCGHGMCYKCRRERKAQNLDFKCAECKEPVGDHTDYLYFKHFDLVIYAAGLQKDKSVDSYRCVKEAEDSRSELYANLRSITVLMDQFRESGSRNTKRMKIEGGIEEMDRAIVEWKKEFARKLKVTDDITVHNGYLHVHRKGVDVSRLKPPKEDGD